jgi:hypothetical protein
MRAQRPVIPGNLLRFGKILTKPIGELLRKVHETLLFVTCDVYCLKSQGNTRPIFLRMKE